MLSFFQFCPASFIVNRRSPTEASGQARKSRAPAEAALGIHRIPAEGSRGRVPLLLAAGATPTGSPGLSGLSTFG